MWTRTLPDPVSFSCVIPFRDRGPDRRDNLLATIDWYSGLEKTELLVVEQDERSTIDPAALSADVRHLFLYNPGAFNKSWAFNVGAINAAGEVLAFIDGDLLVAPAVIQACFEQCGRGMQAINPYSALIDLDRERSAQCRRTGHLADGLGHTINRDYKGQYLCFCGGAYVMRKDAYLDLGGQDERFRGWGGEDDAMSMKVGLLEHIAVNRNAVAYHLFHAPVTPDPEAHTWYRENLALLEEYRRMRPVELKVLCSRQRGTMGNPDKYRSE